MLRGLALGAAAVTVKEAIAQQGEPIKIGMGMALTGGLASGGKVMLITLQMWAEDINARGGLLGRPVKLIYYDDQTNGSLVPGIYTKLLDVDKVDILFSSYATNVVAPAMPVIIQRNKVFLSMFCIGLNTQFHYARYFSMHPAGPNPKPAFSEGFFRVVMDSLIKLSGSSGLLQDNPVQRCWRDVHAISSHVVMNWDVPAENFGRMELGLSRNEAYPAF